MNSENELVVYRCTDCGKTSESIGSLHAHINARCNGFGPYGIIPNPKVWINPFDKAMEKTEILRADEYERVTLDDIEVQL